MKKPSVLSIGYTRDLWESGDNDTRSRLEFYASRLERYWLVTNSYKRHGLQPQRRGNMDLVPTDARGPIDSFLKMLRIGSGILRRHRVTVVQAQDPILTGLAATLLAKWHGVPVNVCVYGPNVFDPYWVGAHWTHRFQAPLGRWVLRRADSIQVDGLLTARRLRESLGEGVPIHAKPMIPSHFGALLGIEKSSGPDPDRFRMVFIGRLEQQKNLAMLADVFVRVHEAFAPLGVRIEMEVLGDGSQRAEFEARLSPYAASGAVVFRGQVAASELSRALREADALVLTSYYEGFPRVMMEAAASGVALVTTAVSGSDEAVVDGTTGFVTPIGDRAAFVERLSRLIRDPALRRSMGEAGRRHIREALAASSDHAEKQIRIWEALDRS
jgi:glycosyltransferase involved in cell wall biosynthesis